jgi:hypothetical protein
MRRPAPLPESLGAFFTVSSALDLGVTRDRLRAGDLIRPFTGARSTTTPMTTRDHALALAPLLGPGQHFSHLTAAELLGLRMPERRLAQTLHVTYREAHRSMRRPNVIGHKSRETVPIMELPNGLRVSSPVAAWCESAALITLDDLIVMGDGLVSRRAPVADIEQLKRVVNNRPGRRGTARLRAALPWIRARTDSARETELRLLVTRAGFPEPEVNFPLVDDNGTLIAHGDLVWPNFRVMLEYEGRQHAEDTDQFAIDIRRLDNIAEIDYRVIRVDRQLMARRGTLFRKIATALAARGWRPDSPAEGSQRGLMG